MTETGLLTPKECATYRRCSVRKLDRERSEGRGPPFVRIDGRIFYRRGDVDRFIAYHIHGGEFREAGECPKQPARGAARTEHTEPMPDRHDRVGGAGTR
jgi:hypothetical protein